MKKRIFTSLSFFSIVAIAVMFMSNAGGRASQGSGHGNTGAPGDEAQSCSGCHGNGIGVTMSFNVFEEGTTTPVTAYVPGTTYDISVTVNHVSGATPAKYGFQAVCLKAANANVGGWSVPLSNTKIKTVNSTGRAYIEQNGPSTTNTFGCKWTAPAAGTGDVKFYTAGVGVNGNNMSSGDGGNKTSLILPEFTNTTGIDTPSNTEASFNVFPNPAGSEAFIQANGMESGVYNVSVVGLDGKVLSTSSVNLDVNGEMALPNFSSLPNGVFVVRLQNAQFSKSVMVTKN